LVVGKPTAKEKCSKKSLNVLTASHGPASETGNKYQNQKSKSIKITTKKRKKESQLRLKPNKKGKMKMEKAGGRIDAHDPRTGLCLGSNHDWFKHIVLPLLSLLGVIHVVR
jgi:hypothetical protein